MTSRDLAVTTGSLIAVAAWITASMTAWLLVTAPTTIAMAVSGQDVDSFARAAVRAIYVALTRFIEYF